MSDINTSNQYQFHTEEEKNFCDNNTKAIECKKFAKESFQRAEKSETVQNKTEIDPNSVSVLSLPFITHVTSDIHTYPTEDDNVFTERVNKSTKSQYVVNVLVSQSTSFNVQIGDQMQIISGPATVRMVSNTPPEPIQTPNEQDQVVQQIVDDTGVLTHIIISPHTSATNNNSSASFHLPLHSPYTEIPLSHINFHHHHNHYSLAPNSMPVVTNKDQRTSKRKERLQMKLQLKKCVTSQFSSKEAQLPLPDNEVKRCDERIKDGDDLSFENVDSDMNNSDDNSNTDNLQPFTAKINSNSFYHTGNNRTQDGNKVLDNFTKVKKSLSEVEEPKILSVESCSAVIKLTWSLMFGENDLQLDKSNVFYKLFLCKNKDDSLKYAEVYSGEAFEITLKDLTPASTFFIKYQCYDSKTKVYGNMSPVHSFTTLPTIPEIPSGPKLVAKTKTSLQLKWNSVPDNGSKIASYLLECDQGRSEFIEVYNGPQKQFKITKLLPSIKYSFRLAAVNSCGKSEYSDPVSYQTSGSPPCQTDPPLLSEPTSKTLVISWNKRPSDLVFTLQMDDESTGHGFLTVYNGPDISYRVTGLKRNSEYKFRLQSQNDEGYSKWSGIVCFKTLPDRPQPPSKPVLKMKPSSTFFKIQWDEPRDLGGISISHYIVHLLKNQAYEEYSRVQDKEVCVENLTPGCTYKVKIQAAGNGGVSEFSDMLTVTTQAVPPSPCKQPKLCGGKPKPSHFSVTWDPPDNDGGAAVAEYVVMIKMIDRGEVVNDNEESRSQDVYRGADTYCTIAGLAAGRLHEVFVKSYNKAGWSEWSDPLRVTTGCSSPDPPSPPVVTCRSPYSCTLKWTAPNNNGAEITEYRLFGKLIKEESNGKMEDLGIHTEVLSKISAETDEDFVMLYNGPLLCCEINKLIPASRYTFKVVALNNVGSSLPSLSSTFQTLPGCPSSVISLKVEQVKATSCTLSWKRPRSNGSSILSYNLDLVGFKIISIEKDLCTVTINELTPDTLYKARIQAINNVGCSPYGSVIKFSTISLPPLSPKLEMVSCSAKFVKLKWGDGKNNDHTKYILEIAENGENYGQIYEGTNHSFKVHKLNELTEYHFRIQAFNDAGAGPISDPIIITTSKSPPPPVKAPHIANISTTTCKIMWPSIKITGCQDDIQYNLQLLRPSDSSFQQIYQGPLCSFELFDLAPNCEYQTRVCAIRKQSSSWQLNQLLPVSSFTQDSKIVAGPYSPTTAFNTKVNIGSASSSSQPKKCLPSSSLRVSFIDGYSQVKLFNDKACAIAIMTIFLMIALVVSYIVSHYMSFQFPSSFSSISPSSS